MNKIAVFLSVVLLTSCSDFFETTVDIETPIPEDKLVVNLISEIDFPNSKVYVSDLATLNEPEIDVLAHSRTDAIVTLENLATGGTELAATAQYLDIPLFDHGTSFFDSEQSIILRIEDPDYPVLETQITIPAAPVISSVTFVEDAGINLEGDNRSGLDITLNDPTGENYYEFELQNIRNGDEGVDISWLETFDSGFSRSGTWENLLLEDTEFDGEEYSFRLLLSFWDESQTDRLRLRVKSVTRDYYLWSRSIRGYRDNEENPFATPVQIHSNIDGGVGIFAIHNGVNYNF